MVDLTTTYDSLIHKKVFMLKGEESYAKTVSIDSSLISFSDSESHMSNARYGLAIKVLRNLGDSSIVIYDNDKLITLNDGSTLKAIPCLEDISSATFPTGVYYDDTTGSIIVGLEDDDTTGLYLLYDIEHNIRVKYLSNEYCTSSSSKIKRTIETPLHFISLLDVTPSKTSYGKGETVSVTATLTNGEGTPIANAPLTIYDNGTQISGTFTTDSNGEYTYTDTITDKGIHTFEFRYSGLDDNYLPCESSTDISYGYVFDVPSDTVWFGNGGSINVSLYDYDNNPVNGVTVYCDFDGISVVSGTTNSDGIVTLTHSNNNDLNDPLTVYTTYNGVNDVSDEFHIDTTVTIDLTMSLGENTFTSSGMSDFPIYIHGEMTNSLDETIPFNGLEVDIMNPFVSPLTVKLDSNGDGVCYYHPDGRGSITVDALVPEYFLSESCTFVDYDMAWYYPKSYGNHVLVEMSNGMQLKDVATGYGLFSNYSLLSAYIWFDTRYDYSNKYEFSFKIVSASSKGIRVGSINLPNVTTGSRIMMIVDNGTTTMYVDGSLYGTYNRTNETSITINQNNDGQSIVIDEVKIGNI